MDEIIYTCSVCGKQAPVKKGDTIPLCCRKEMGPLPYCTEAPNPEMARNYNEDGACDDGTSPKPGWPKPKK